MADDWSAGEVEAAVRDYITMLEAERAGIAYSKTAHRVALAPQLKNRSKGSIERKHQNISAVLNALGVRPIDGYKPLSNYQQLLFDVVADEIDKRPELKTALIDEATRAVVVPQVDDILRAMVEGPARRPFNYKLRNRVPPRIRRGVNFLAVQAANTSIGSAGEEFVVRYEQARLISEGKEKLASRVDRVSISRGDGLGYDVLSYSADTTERLIEVKTTASIATCPFYVTPNEVQESMAHPDKYYLYRVFDFYGNPKLFWRAGQIE